jgi:hypothetical protein
MPVDAAEKPKASMIAARKARMRITHLPTRATSSQSFK